MHHKPLMMHGNSKCDGGGACLKHVEWVGRDAEQLEPCPTDYIEQWQADHAPFPGNVCCSSLLRSLRADDRVSAYERYRPTGKPRALGTERR
jgi:hypothetical protein